MGRKTWTIRDLLGVTAEYLGKKGIGSPRLDAEILLARQLETTRVGLYLNFDQPLNDREIEGYRTLIKRRAGREPIQYIVGTQEFWSLDFRVGPDVMIPRSESELLVEEVLSLCREQRLPENRSPKILDLGTGCGALAVALARELHEASIWASDVSPEALNLARRNARRHGVEDRIEFILSDMWEGLVDHSLAYDIILSNPPYIPTEAMESLPPEVRDHEPRLALDGGEGGMLFISRILMEAPNYLRPGGWVLLEMDPEQTRKSLKLIEKVNRYGEKIRLRDYSGHYRAVMAQRSSPSRS